ncbi:MAG: hypothetical protein ABI595_13820, partial [Actinomycetota bacterium]
MAAGARALEAGLGPHYTAMFLSSMRQKVAALLARHPGQAARVDAARTRRARTFFEFDDAATAPLHGFAGVDDYYGRSSSQAFLSALWEARHRTR